MKGTKPDKFINELSAALARKDGRTVSTFLSLQDLDSIRDITNDHLSPAENSKNFHYYDGQIRNKLPSPWDVVVQRRFEVAVCTVHLRSHAFAKQPPLTPQERAVTLVALDAQLALVEAVRGLMLVAEEETSWAVEVVLVGCRDAKTLARMLKRADRVQATLHTIERCFELCIHISATARPNDNRLGAPYLASLGFKLNLSLGHVAEMGSIVERLAGLYLIPRDLPRLEHRVPYLYLLGMWAFLREDYSQAEANFELALGQMCDRADSQANQAQVLLCLISIRLARGVLPNLRKKRFSRVGSLKKLFKPLVKAIKKGDVASFDRQLASHAGELKAKRVYVLLQSARLVVVRSFLKQVWKVRGCPGVVRVGELGGWLSVNRGEGFVESDEAREAVESLLEQGHINGHLEVVADEVRLVLAEGAHGPFPWYDSLRPVYNLDLARREALRKERLEARLSSPQLRSAQARLSLFHTTEPAS